MSTLRTNNSSGVTGVNWNKDRFTWRCKISYRGKSVYLGSYKNFQNAKAVRKGAEKALATLKLHKPSSIKVIGVSTTDIVLIAIIPETVQELSIRLLTTMALTDSEPGVLDCGGKL